MSTLRSLEKSYAGSGKRQKKTKRELSTLQSLFCNFIYLLAAFGIIYHGTADKLRRSFDIPLS